MAATSSSAPKLKRTNSINGEHAGCIEAEQVPYEEVLCQLLREEKKDNETPSRDGGNGASHR